ncbi:MAG: hemerythrin domain-containing protein [Propionibacteriales bacterium]|nr:hemerythrin domain-containing protein [Propionibacteriales bacterium]
MPDVIDLIKADHREVERLFDQLQNEPDKRAAVLPVLSALLIAHSRAEEAEVYPVARDEAGETDEVAHSQDEHAEAEEILTRLRGEDPTTPTFDEVLKELVDAVTHHVEEEESRVLPGMRGRLGDDRREALADAFAASRAQHLGESPGEPTKEELETQAKNKGMSGASGKSKDELSEELKP